MVRDSISFSKDGIPDLLINLFYSKDGYCHAREYKKDCVNTQKQLFVKATPLTWSAGVAAAECERGSFNFVIT
jgi:hypothetical protein